MTEIEFDQAKADLIKKYPYQFNNYTQFYLSPGWLALFSELCERIDKFFESVTLKDKETFKWVQIKEKFACLRAYADYSGERGADIQEIIRDAENRASVTCEKCGDDGKRGNPTGHWLHAVCDKHNNKDFSFFDEK